MAKDMMPDGGGRPMGDMFAGMIDRLTSDAADRVRRRLVIEQRWLEDLRQFEGRDDDNVISRLAADGRSTAVVNITRSKCNTFESKLYDMLFPTDDRNWAISPTPVPDLDLEMKGLSGEVDRMTMTANVEDDEQAAMQGAQQADQLAQRIAEIDATRQQARDQANLMEEEIADNLVECEYSIHCRNVIHDATVTGTGILKGPMPLSERIRKNWLRDDAGKYRLRHDPDGSSRFVYQHVSYWNVYPDSTARHFGQVESWMERHLMRARDLREFAKQPGVDKDAIRRIIEEGPMDIVPQHLIDIDTVYA